MRISLGLSVAALLTASVPSSTEERLPAPTCLEALNDSEICEVLWTMARNSYTEAVEAEYDYMLTLLEESGWTLQDVEHLQDDIIRYRHRGLMAELFSAVDEVTRAPTQDLDQRYRNIRFYLQRIHDLPLPNDVPLMTMDQLYVFYPYLVERRAESLAFSINQHMDKFPPCVSSNKPVWNTEIMPLYTELNQHLIALQQPWRKFFSTERVVLLNGILEPPACPSSPPPTLEQPALPPSYTPPRPRHRNPLERALALNT